MIIFVGSTNPVKVNAVTKAASEQWPEVRTVSIDVPSGISAQPMSDEETKTGATNRARAAFEDGMATLSQEEQEAYDRGEREVLGVGLEGGVEEHGDSTLWSTVWACVYHPDDGNFYANGARFEVPEVIASRILKGEEMGNAAKPFANGTEVKRTKGVIGIITNGFIDRTEEYSGIAKLALGIWYGRNWLDAV